MSETSRRLDGFGVTGLAELLLAQPEFGGARGESLLGQQSQVARGQGGGFGFDVRSENEPKPIAVEQPDRRDHDPAATEGIPQTDRPVRQVPGGALEQLRSQTYGI